MLSDIWGWLSTCWCQFWLKVLGTLGMTLPGSGHDVGLLFKIVVRATLHWARPLGGGMSANHAMK